MSIDKDFSLVFLRLIDGQEYDGVVKAKEQAQQQYTEAVSRGQSAGLVRYMDERVSVSPGLIQMVFMLYFVEEPCVSFGMRNDIEKNFCCTNYIYFF